MNAKSHFKSAKDAGFLEYENYKDSICPECQFEDGKHSLECSQYKTKRPNCDGEYKAGYNQAIKDFKIPNKFGEKSL